MRRDGADVMAATLAKAARLTMENLTGGGPRSFCGTAVEMPPQAPLGLPSVMWRTVNLMLFYLTIFLDRSPDTATAEDLRRFQLHLTEPPSFI
jgi:hypothetical protein